MSTVLGVIAARGGSKGLPGKNIKPLGGVPLIGWTIRAAKQSKTLTHCWVSTEDAAIAKIARDLGADVPFTRPASLAQDDSSIFDVLRHAAGEFKAKTGKNPDVVVLLQATSPLRRAEHIDAAVRLVLEDGADSAQTVTLDETHPHHRFLLEKGRLKPMFPEAERHSRRQDSPAVYRPNGAVYAARWAVLEKGTLQGADHRAVIMDFESSVDVDGLWDLKLAELIVAGT